MFNRVKDITGKRFGSLVVKRLDSIDKDRHSRWECICDCGRTTKVLLSNIKKMKSCGCLKIESTKRSNTTHGCYRNYKESPEIRVYRAMHDRCSNPSNDSFLDYGGRGIRVCERWSNFQNFYEDMGARPSDKYSIDRIEVNGNYEPSNVRWATIREQSLNKRNTIKIDSPWGLLTIREISEITGISISCISGRLRRNVDPSKLFQVKTNI